MILQENISMMYPITTKIGKLPLAVHISGKSSDNLSDIVSESQTYKALPSDGKQIMADIKQENDAYEDNFNGDSFSSLQAAARIMQMMGFTHTIYHDYNNPVLQMTNILAAIINVEYDPMSTSENDIQHDRIGAYGFKWDFDDPEDVVGTLLSEFGTNDYTMSLIDKIDKRYNLTSNVGERLQKIKEAKDRMRKGLVKFAKHASSFFDRDNLETTSQVKKTEQNYKAAIKDLSGNVEENLYDEIAFAIFLACNYANILSLPNTFKNHFGVVLGISLKDRLSKEDIKERLRKVLKA